MASGGYYVLCSMRRTQCYSTEKDRLNANDGCYFLIVTLEIQAADLYSLDCLCFPSIEIKIFQVERLYSFTAESIQKLQTTRKMSIRLVEMLIILLLLLLNLKVGPRNQKRIGL